VIGSAQPLLARLCQAAARVLAVDGVAVSVRLGSTVSLPISATDEEAAAAEELQFSLGEGPGLYSSLSAKKIFVPDLDQPGPSRQWPLYVAEALRRGSYRAVFAFPFALAGCTVGTLDLYRRAAGPTLSEAEITAADHITSQIAADLRTGGRCDIAGRRSDPDWIGGRSLESASQVGWPPWRGQILPR
jgi:GAF domain-containing protein